ncbi:MAG: hypothetical protein LUF29_03780 [Oscillospiraceae bacterium]|nr:hypothetical protein [Oscillospiraceae bacterium]
MRASNRNIKNETRIYTTHCRDGTPPIMLGKIMVINGEKVFAYEKDGIVQGYIPLDEVNRVMYLILSGKVPVCPCVDG